MILDCHHAVQGLSCFNKVFIAPLILQYCEFTPYILSLALDTLVPLAMMVGLMRVDQDHVEFGPEVDAIFRTMLARQSLLYMMLKDRFCLGKF